MTTDYHTAFGVDETITILEINERLADLDEAIGNVDVATLSVAVLTDEKATTTDGGSASAATWNLRDLNTLDPNPSTIVSLSSNKFVPVSGTYEIEVYACASQVDAHRVRLYNVTTGTAVITGINMDVGTGGIGQIASLCRRFTANGTDEYRIEHYTETARATDGLGQAVGDGSNEIYCTVILRKLT